MSHEELTPAEKAQKRQDEAFATLQSIVLLQAFTIGLLFGSHIRILRELRKLGSSVVVMVPEKASEVVENASS